MLLATLVQNIWATMVDGNQWVLIAIVCYRVRANCAKNNRKLVTIYYSLECTQGPSSYELITLAILPQTSPLAATGPLHSLRSCFFTHTRIQPI